MSQSEYLLGQVSHIKHHINLALKRRDKQAVSNLNAALRRAKNKYSHYLTKKAGT